MHLETTRDNFSLGGSLPFASFQHLRVLGTISLHSNPVKAYTVCVKGAMSDISIFALDNGNTKCSIFMRMLKSVHKFPRSKGSLSAFHH